MKTQIEAVHFIVHIILYILTREFQMHIRLSRSFFLQLALDISIFNFEEQPYGQYWTNKNGTYNYGALKSQYPNNKHSLITDVSTMKLKEDLDSTKRPKYPVGFIKFTVSTIRFPRI